MITLSDKRFDDSSRGFGYYGKDVKEFIRKLKTESICKDCSVGYDVGCDCEDQVFLLNTRYIDTEAGEELI